MKSEFGSHSSSIVPRRRRKRWDSDLSSGRPVSESAIFPARTGINTAAIDSTNEIRLSSSSSSPGLNSAPGDIDLDLKRDLPGKSETPENENASANSQGNSNGTKKKTRPVVAYQFRNTIIVEDEDGEVVKKYDLPSPPSASRSQDIKERLGVFLGYHKPQTKNDFLKEIQTLDPEARAQETSQGKELEPLGPPKSVSIDDSEETPAERRRREAALGITGHVGNSDDSEEDDHPGESSAAKPPVTDRLELPAEIEVMRTSSLGPYTLPRKPKSCLKPPSPSPTTSCNDAGMSEHESWETDDIAALSQRGRSPSGKGKAIDFNV